MMSFFISFVFVGFAAIFAALAAGAIHWLFGWPLWAATLGAAGLICAALVLSCAITRESL